MPGLEMTQLVPATGTNAKVLSASLHERGVPLDSIPSNAHAVLLIPKDGATIAAALAEMSEILVLHLAIVNTTASDMVVSPADFVLMDADGSMFKRLEPHEAANKIAAWVTPTPSFTRKGRQAYGGKQAHTGIPPGYYGVRTHRYPDPVSTAASNLAEQSAYSFASGNRRSVTEKYMATANTLFELGLSDSLTVPARTTARGAVIWLKRPFFPKPARLTVLSLDREYEFVKD